jgi:hypothetical protein
MTVRLLRFGEERGFRLDASRGLKGQANRIVLDVIAAGTHLWEQRVRAVSRAARRALLLRYFRSRSNGAPSRAAMIV